MEEADRWRKTLASLEQRAETLEKRINRLIGRVDAFTPKVKAIMQEGVPLEIYTRLALISAEFEVFNPYSFEYYDRGRGAVERSVDIYASKDSIYQWTEGEKQFQRPERSHILVEVKQRTIGVEWIFSQRPTTRNVARQPIQSPPVANVALEIRPTMDGVSGNPNSIANGIAQLGQSFIPFYLGLDLGHEIDEPGFTRRYAMSRRHDGVYLLLVTNAKLRYFRYPEAFSQVGNAACGDDALFEEVPWVTFSPETSLSLRYHQEQTIIESGIKLKYTQNSAEYFLLESLQKHAQSVDIVNFDHLAQYFAYIDDPPRIKSIQFNLSVDGKPPDTFSIGPED